MKRKALFFLSLVLVMSMLFPSVAGAFKSIAVSGVTLSKTSIEVKVGQTQALSASIKPTNATNKTIAWSSSNTKVATVDSKGVVKGIAEGKATITAKTGNSKISAKCNVSVISAKIFSKPTKVSMMTMSHPSYPYDPKWVIWDAIKKATNVDLEVLAYGNAEYNDKVTLTIASGKLPDIMYLGTELMNRFALDGPFVSVLDNLKYCPNFSEWYKTDKNAAITLKTFKSADGKLYVFPLIGGEPLTNVRGFLLRMDMLATEKIAVPTTYDQLYQVLRVFKKRYPTSYPFAMRDVLSGNRFLELLGCQWNTGLDVYYNYDKGQFRYGATEPNFKALLDWLKKCYKEGLVPPDLFTINTKGWTDLISNNQSFVTMDYLARIDGFNTPMRKANPNFNMDWIKPPKGNVPDGKALMLKTNYTGGGDCVCNTSNKVNALKFTDWFYSREGKDITNWGVEGVSYKKNADGTKEYISTPSTDTKQKLFGLRTFGVNIGQDLEAMSTTVTPQSYTSHMNALKYTTKDFNPKWYLSFNKQELDVKLTLEESIRNKTDQFISKYVTGELGADQYDNYCKEIKALGIDKFIGIYESAYARVNK